MTVWLIVFISCEFAALLSMGPQYNRLAALFRKPLPPLEIQWRPEGKKDEPTPAVEPVPRVPGEPVGGPPGDDKEGEEAGEGRTGGQTPTPLSYETIRDANQIDGEVATDKTHPTSLPTESIRAVTGLAKRGVASTSASETG